MYGFAAFVRDSELFVFGGFDGRTVYRDFWAVKLKDAATVWNHIQEDEEERRLGGKKARRREREDEETRRQGGKARMRGCEEARRGCEKLRRLGGEEAKVGGAYGYILTFESVDQTSGGRDERLCGALLPHHQRDRPRHPNHWWEERRSFHLSNVRGTIQSRGGRREERGGRRRREEGGGKRDS
jgi:hypothetical protein